VNIENPALVTWSVLIILALIFLQGIGLGLALFFLEKQISSVQKHATRLGNSVSQLLHRTDRLLVQAESLHRNLPSSFQKVSSSLRWFNWKMAEVDGFAAKNMSLVSDQLTRVSDRSDQLLSGFGAATYKIHRAVINPARHFSAALSAIQESILWFFTRGHEEDRDQAHPDEQNFI